MTYADSTERAALISGLRALADYLDSNPEAPAPIYSQVYAFPPEAEWSVMQAEVTAVAERLGGVAYSTYGGHVFTGWSFGPVEYRVIAIPPRNDNEQSE
jgi:hypothetical protein